MQGTVSTAPRSLTSPPTPSIASSGPIASTRSVSLSNLHTGEQMEAVYWADGDYIPDVLDAVNVQLRDFRTGDVYPIHPQLLDLLDSLNSLTGTRSKFQVISGYRSAATNALLRERSEEVAKHSFHMSGMAIDIRLPDVDLSRLHAAALSLGRGGVGYYPYSNFVHVDVGPVRTWYG
ncbi:MAG TPA: DUF882 domain-containing protein [Caulobacteraceae bacterium]|nr:DUF882 domain-containing protein [Caulobacteraceae bacterium]